MALPKLSGRQHQVVYLPANGHHVVQGTAGSGKTVMAILRAGHLARSSTVNYGSTLLLTHDNSLVNYLRFMADGAISDVRIETYAKFARGYLASRGRMRDNCILTETQAVVSRALDAARIDEPSADGFFARPVEFFQDELEWIAGNGLSTKEDYLAAQRFGRKEALQPSQRAAMWVLRNKYLEAMASIGKMYDWANLASAVRLALGEDGTTRRYRHIIVDEAQDFSPEVLRSLSEAIQPGGSLTLFLDESQQIYGQRTSWKSVGLRVSKIESFNENYRNSAEIAAVALAMVDMPHFRDIPDIVPPSGTSRAAGSKPTLFIASDEAAELREVRARIIALGRTGSVAVLGRTRAEARRMVSGISGSQLISRDMPPWTSRPGVYYGTYFSAKGLEFEVVVLPFADAAKLPLPSIVAAFGRDEAMARESRQLYVGVTRARTELLVSCSGVLTALLPDMDSDVWTVVRA